MSHEEVQVNKLIKYNRKSHEMITLICKRIPTTVNKKMHKNEHSHEMTRFRNQIAIWSSLHKPILIYRSSHGSVFESPLYRVHNEHESGLGPGLLQRSGSHRTNPKHCSTQPTHTYKHKYTINTHTCSRTHTCIPTYTYIYKYKLTIMHT